MKTMRAYLAVPLVRQSLMLLILATLALAVLHFGLKRPLQRELAVETAQFDALQGETRELLARIRSVDTFAAKERQLAMVQARFEAPVDRAGVVTLLTELSAISGTRIIHGANTFGRPRGSVTPVEQDLTIEGSYAAVAKFLGGLPELETLTLLRSAEFSANPAGTLVRAKIKLVTLSRGAGE